MTTLVRLKIDFPPYNRSRRDAHRDRERVKIRKRLNDAVYEISDLKFSPMKTTLFTSGMFAIRQTFRAKKNCANISSDVRSLNFPMRPVAQNLHPVFFLIVVSVVTAMFGKDGKGSEPKKNGLTDTFQSHSI